MRSSGDPRRDEGEPTLREALARCGYAAGGILIVELDNLVGAALAVQLAGLSLAGAQVAEAGGIWMIPRP